VIDLVSVSPAFAQDGTVVIHVELSGDRYVGVSDDAGRSWRHVPTTMTLRNVRRFAFSSAYGSDGTIFAATSNNGSWKTTDRGDSWSWSGAGLPSASVRDLAVSPGYAVDHVVLAATAGGVGRSTNGGVTWTSVGPPGNYTVVAFAPDGGGTAFAGGDDLYRSTDGGLTWSLIGVFPWPAVRLTVSPLYSSDGTLAVCFGQTAPPQPGVLVSTDGGASFSGMSSGLSDPSVNDVAIADDGTFFAVADGAACFRADAAFGSWTLFSSGFEAFSPQTTVHYRAVAVSPAFSSDGAVFVGAFEGFFSSDDRGETWRQRELYHQLINRALAFSPSFATDGRLYAGNYGGGPYLWDEIAKRWSALGAEIQHLFSGAFAISPTFAIDQTMLYGYTGLWKTTDAGANWFMVAPVGGGVVRGLAMSPQFAVDGVAFMNRPDAGGTFRTTDGGGQWVILPDLANGLDGLAISPEFATDATVFSAVDEASAGMLRSTDGGDTWQDVSGAIGTARTQVIAVSPSFAVDGVVLAGTRQHGLYRSTDRGDSWGVLPGLPSGAADKIESIAFSPDFANDGTVYVVSFYDGVQRSTDGGTSWEAMNGGLPLDAKRRIAVSPAFASDRMLYVATHAWVYRSTDAGESWWPLPGYVRVNDRHQSVWRSGGWTVNFMSGDYGTETTGNATAGAWEELEFYGGRIAWVVRRNNASGLARVLLDGQEIETIDLYAPQTEYQKQVFVRTLATDWHVIRVEVLGQRNPSSSGTWVRSDGYEYFSILADGTVDATDVVQRWRVLEQNRPNPFGPGTTIGYVLDRAGPVRLSIHDVRGTVVRTLLEQIQPAGSHRVQWDGRNDAGHPVASGVYFYEIQAGPLRETRKMIRLR
jgi:hypothetical protein